MATMQYVRQGSTRQLSTTFKSEDDGTAVDPDGVEFEMVEPDGTVTPYTHGSNDELVKDSTGVYYVSWTFDQIGPHRWKLNGTGTNGEPSGGKIRVH